MYAQSKDTAQSRMTYLERQVKILTCLNEISAQTESHHLPMGEILAKVADIMPNVWPCLDIIGVRIRINGFDYRSENFRMSEFKKTIEIPIGKDRVGSLEINLRNPLPEDACEDNGVVGIIADKLKRFVEQRRLQKTLQRYHDQLELQMVASNEQLKGEIEERKRAEATLRQRNRELRLINQSSDAFNSILDLDRVLETVMEEIRSLFDVIGTSVWLSDPETGDLVCRHASGPKSQFVLNLRVGPGEGLVGWVLENGESLVVPDAQNDQRHLSKLKNLIKLEVHSILCAPLRSREKVIGVLQVVDTQPNRFDKTHLVLLEALAASAAIAIDNARLFRQARQEIDDRKQAESRLMESEEKYRVILESIEDGYYEVDLSANFVFINESMAEILGYTEKDILGMNIRKFMDSQNARKVFLTYQKAYDTGRSDKGFEFEIITGRGQRKHVETSVSFTTDSNGGRVGLRGILRDISDRKRVEGMVRAKAMAESASRAKSQFLASMSHEIRTPLNGILGMTELLADTEMSDYQKNLVAILSTETDALLLLINDILDFSKIEAGKIELEEIAFAFGNMMDDVTKPFSVRAEQKGLAFSFRKSRDIPARLVGDPGRIRQVLTNLIGNALKFTSVGEITVEADVAKDFDDHILIRFAVKDTGIGIPENRIPAIFDSFTQADAATSRKFGGTGLGTAISKSLVELMGGEIRVHSVEGKGSTFQFTVLLKKQLEKEENRVPGIVTSKTRQTHEIPVFEKATPKISEKLRILVAEDYPINRKIAMMHLQQAGYWADLVGNGKEAVDAFLRNHYDLVLMDLEMPEMDGIEATEKIRRLEQEYGVKSGVPIIGVTAHALKEFREKCLASGMNDYIAKPLKRDRLLGMIEKWTSPSPIQKNEIGAGPARNDTGDPMDFDRMLIDFMGDRKAVINVLDTFSGDAANMIKTIRQAISGKDTKTVGGVAHQMKGAALGIAADKLATLANGLELAVKSGDFEKSATCLSLLENESRRLEVFSKKLRSFYS